MRSSGAVVLCLALATAALAELPRPSTQDATLGAIALPGPLAERSRALTTPIHFRSRGTITALFVKMNRDIKIAMAPVRTGNELTALDTTVLDLAGGNKRYHGVLPFSPEGTVHADAPKLVNATNILNLHPALREQLRTGAGPVEATGMIETDGVLRPVHITHALETASDQDGNIVLRSTTVSDDEAVHFTTMTTMAPDGLPLHAETTGTVAKGPIDVAVDIRLTRE